MTDDGIRAQIDYLSPLGARLLKFDRAGAYQLLTVPGDGNAEAREILDSVKPADLLAVPIVNHDNAACVLGGLWLWHDWLEQSHRICQAIDTPTGSFWHAIMHRREGDFSNSKYWYRKVDEHPAYPSIANNAAAVLNPLPIDKSWVRLTNGGWQAAHFVDLVEQNVNSNDAARRRILVNLQQLEWRMLFDHCVRQAVGK